jgi:hypothetical protein
MVSTRKRTQQDSMSRSADGDVHDLVNVPQKPKRARPTCETRTKEQDGGSEQTNAHADTANVEPGKSWYETANTYIHTIHCYMHTHIHTWMTFGTHKHIVTYMVS